MWWKKANKKVYSLRKHVLRVDLHTHVGEASDFNNENDLKSALHSLVASAVYKGLDILGVVSHEGIQIGQIAQQLVQEQGVDLYVIPGMEYVTSDGIRFILFNLQKPLTPNLDAEQAILEAHKNGAFVLVINATSRQIQKLNKFEGTDSAPNAVEVYDAAVGSYKDIDTNYPTFASSAAKSASELDKLNIYTLVPRKELEEIGLLPQNTGIDYTPNYLQRLDDSY